MASRKYPLFRNKMLKIVTKYGTLKGGPSQALKIKGRFHLKSRQVYKLFIKKTRKDIQPANFTLTSDSLKNTITQCELF